MQAYYHKWEPRRDLLTGDLIFCEKVERYRSAYFNSRENFLNWLKVATPDAIRAYVKQWMLDRKTSKGLVFAPSQVILRTANMVGVKYISTLFNLPYNVFVETLGFKARFSHYNWLTEKSTPQAAHKILVDSKEQLPLAFNVATETTGLLFADYALNDMDVSNHCFIERKSVNDLYKTLGNVASFTRFNNELRRAKSAGAYIVVLVEDSIQGVIDAPPQGERKVPHHVIFHNVRELMETYDNIQFLFVNNRDDASKAVERIFYSKGEFKKIDLQYLYDTGGLI
jgi:hypothetical protein